MTQLLRARGTDHSIDVPAPQTLAFFGVLATLLSATDIEEKLSTSLATLFWDFVENRVTSLGNLIGVLDPSFTESRFAQDLVLANDVIVGIEDLLYAATCSSLENAPTWDRPRLTRFLSVISTCWRRLMTSSQGLHRPYKLLDAVNSFLTETRCRGLMDMGGHISETVFPRNCMETNVQAFSSFIIGMNQSDIPASWSNLNTFRVSLADFMRYCKNDFTQTWASGTDLAPGLSQLFVLSGPALNRFDSVTDTTMMLFASQFAILLRNMSSRRIKMVKNAPPQEAPMTCLSSLLSDLHYLSKLNFFCFRAALEFSLILTGVNFDLQMSEIKPGRYNLHCWGEIRTISKDILRGTKPLLLWPSIRRLVTPQVRAVVGGGVEERFSKDFLMAWNELKEAIIHLEHADTLVRDQLPSCHSPTVRLFRSVLSHSLILQCDAEPRGKAKRCTGCLSVGYCSVTCQRDHWAHGHSKDCVSFVSGKVSNV